MTATLKPRDAELLSAYLDDALNAQQRTLLEKRMAADSLLQSELEDFRQLRQLLRAVPMRRSPRKLTLTPEMVPARQSLAAFNWLRYSSAVAAIALVLMFVVVDLAPRIPMAYRVAEPMAEVAMEAPAADGAPLTRSPIINWGNPAPYGMGGGGGGGVDGMGGGPVAPEMKAIPMDSTQPQVPSASPVPLDEASPILGIGAEESTSVEPIVRRMPTLPVTLWIEIILAMTALATGLAAWLLRKKSN